MENVKFLHYLWIALINCYLRINSPILRSTHSPNLYTTSSPSPCIHQSCQLSSQSRCKGRSENQQSVKKNIKILFLKILKYFACIGELSAASAVKPTISLKIAFKLIFNTWRNPSSEVQINNALAGRS